jgi:hypothetical protein
MTVNIVVKPATSVPMPQAFRTSIMLKANKIFYPVKENSGKIHIKPDLKKD